MTTSTTLPAIWLDTVGSVDWNSFRSPEALAELFGTISTGSAVDRLRIPLPSLEGDGEQRVLVLQGTDLLIDAAAFLSSGDLNASVSGSIRRLSIEDAFGNPDPDIPELLLNNLPLAELVTVLVEDLIDIDGVIGAPTIALLSSKLFTPTNFIPVSLGEEGDALASGSFFNVGSNETLISYFQKLLIGSSLDPATGLLSTTTLSVDLDSVQLLGYAGTNVSNQSLSGFDHLNLPSADPTLGDVILPNGGLFLTTGGGAYPFTNTRSSFTVGRGQPGLDVLTTFAQEAYPGAGSTRDATVLKFSFTPGADVKSLIIDLVFASDEYPEYANSSFVDIGAIWFDNQLDESGLPIQANYATFDNKPLSVVTDAITDPRFINNNIQGSLSPLPIEFDGITKALKIGIPLEGLTPNEDGSFTINVGIADSGDSALDSAIWISNLVTDKSSVGGTFLPIDVESGGEYVAPPNVPVYATIGPGGSFTPSNKPDFGILPNGPSKIKGTGQQVNGDQYQGVNNETEIVIEEELTEEQILIEEGSAIITLDTNKNGFDPADPKFSLLGDYFDINAFSIETGSGKTTITYNGPTSTVSTFLAISGPPENLAEGYQSPTIFSFTITRDGDTTVGSTVAWAVEGSGDDAADAEDFEGTVLPSGIATFEPGELSKTIDVEVAGDAEQELNEQFTVTLSNPSGGLLNPEASTASGVITNDDLLGSAAADTLVGTTQAEFLDGLGGPPDTLTGGGGPDVFGFRFSHSSFSQPDLITDFKFGEDKIDLFSRSGADLAAPTKLSRASDIRRVKNLNDLANAVYSDADGKRRNNQPLGANEAALVVAKNSPVAGTYLLINDSHASLNSRTDLMINLSGTSGSLPGLGTSAVSSLFVV